MRHWKLGTAVTLSLMAVMASAAVAAVHVRVAVNPTTIQQCSSGTMLVALRNDGTSPILAHVCFALTRNDTVIAGPLCGRAPLAAGETRTREFTFFVPRVLPPGDYAVDARAQASDGSSDHSSAAFTVTANDTCRPASTEPGSVLDGIIQGSGLSSEDPTPIAPSTWGELKIHYR